jgi:hypothetical protein
MIQAFRLFRKNGGIPPLQGYAFQDHDLFPRLVVHSFEGFFKILLQKDVFTS